MPTQEEHVAAAQAVERLFREFAREFPHAHVETDIPGPDGRKGLLRLSCSLPRTTHVTAMPGADQIDLYLGEATWHEILASKRDPYKLLNRVRDIVTAAVDRRFEEHVREFRGRTLGSRSILRFPGRPGTARRFRVSPWLLLPGHVRRVRYKPCG